MANLLSILLQRSDPSYGWGFAVRGGLQDGTPLTIHQVTPGTLASQYLAPGDTILQIEKVDSRILTLHQVESLVRQPKKSLDLLILKGNGIVQPHPSASSVSPGSQNSADSGVPGSSWSERDPRARKQNYWERVSADPPDLCREGFTRLETGGNSPYKTRSPRLHRRCQSEEKSNAKWEDNYSSVYSSSSERDRKISDSSFYSNTIRSIWSPTPSESMKTPNSDFWPDKVGGRRQGDVTFWEYTPDTQSRASSSGRTESLNRSYRRQNSDYSYHSSRISEDAATPKSEFTSPFDAKGSSMRKPSDYWGDHYRDQQGRIRFDRLTSPSRDVANVWKNTNISTKTEFKQSTSISEKSYSSAEGTKSFETYEHLNKTKETEKSSKSVDGGKEEVVEKTKKNKEYVLANKDEIDGQPQESKKVVSDFKIIERVMDGDHEYCNKVKERSEEVTNSSTPVNFYDNVQQHTVEGPEIQRAEWCNHSVNRHKEVGIVGKEGSKSAEEGTEVDSSTSSPIFKKDPNQTNWANSTPIPDAGYVYQQEGPLMENYFEVDIRSPVETQITFASSEDSRRQSSQISGGGGSPIPVSPQGDTQTAPPPCPPAPPPPPPPGIPGSIPAVRLSTEIPDKRRSAYEPPAAIQNAMMTKDKKPFTYTPGGLDLSEIRSPRMARRISRNANAPDLAPCPPKPSPLSNQPLPPSAVAAMQPQIAIPVLPQPGATPQLHHVTPGGYSAPPPPPPPLSHPVSPPVQSLSSPPPQPSSPQKIPPQPPSPQRVYNRQPSPPPMAVPKLQPQHRHSKSEPQSTPGSIYVPPIEPQQPRSQLGSLYIPPLAPQEPPKPQSPVPVSQLNKAPTPWMSRQTQQAQKEVPPWVNRDNVQSPQPQQQTSPNSQQTQTRIIPIQIEGSSGSSQPVTRIIPIQMEGTPSPQHTPAQPNFNQQPQYQQQQQQYQQPQYQQQQYQQPQYQQQQYQQPQYQQHPVYQQQQSYEQPNQGRNTPRWMNQQPIYVHNKFNPGTQSPVPSEQNHSDSQPGWRHSQTNGTVQSPPAPVQSRSFKVLEKIHGSDNGGVDQSDAPYNSQGVPLSQLRKLQLSDDDRALMNKVKSQVPQMYSPVQQNQNRLSMNRTPQPDAPQQYIPPSEQQAPEPRKYMGGAIPSRSFRVLQAMTAGHEAPAVMSDGRKTPQFCSGGEAMWAPNGYPYPPPPPDPNYYYYPPNYPQTPEQQQQFWDHYNAMCSYMAEMNQNYGYSPYGYPPHLYTPPPQPPQHLQYTSDSDECGYSSTDEMNYYAAYFKKYPPPIQPYRGYYPEHRNQTPQIIITPSQMNENGGYSSDFVSDSEREEKMSQDSKSINCSPSVNGDSGETTTDDGSDTEVEDDNVQRPQGLQTIKSVPDIRIYKDSSTSDIQSQNSETDDPDEEEANEEEEEEEEFADQDSIPHQLSVIFEESEQSESESIKKVKQKEVDDLETSENESSTATLDNGDDTDDDLVDPESSMVLVRLPLKLKFSKTENDEEVTTVIVGDSEIKSSSSEEEIREGDLIIQEINRVEEEEPEVSVTFTIPKKKSILSEETVSHSLDVKDDRHGVDVNKDSNLNEDNTRNTMEDFKDGNESICDIEPSVVVSCSDTNNDKENNDIARCVSESPIDFWKELSCDDVPSKVHVPADVSISITLPPKHLTKSGSRSPYDNLTSESDESRPEESDCHWEDDSSSTSVQTVRIGKLSGSDNFSGSEVETAGTADEGEETEKTFEVNKIEDSKSEENTIKVDEEENLDDEHERIPIEDLLYDDSSSSEDDESTSSSSSSSSSEETSEQSKEIDETAAVSLDNSRAEEKIDDDVFFSESLKTEANNRLSVEQKPRKARGSSCKSQDESEEDDSGVTSDMSRHISETDTDPECGSELRKLTPYQRANTHSRLFKLLQDECSQEDDELNQTTTNERSCADDECLSSLKERLSLPLQTSSLSDPDSLSSSSGINSPSSPTVSDRLVRELVQSLLQKKKGRHFRKLPMDKLYAAAMRILQEDMDPYDTVSSTSDDSFRHSPISESTASQTNNNTAINPPIQNHELYGGNYYDYCDYYNTWGNPYYYTGVDDSLGYDILPSRAFRLLQERAQTPHGFSSGVIEGLMAKCPRVLSSKDVPRDFNETTSPNSSPQASSSSET
ncbi:protein piccolo-like isoform X3 [Homalodisca vitripennis]|uniref:protein piccolo-like isoform X3 n=1 Tax=Homalodisca vitripennis TaxID=197043 RepID=UPI001EEAB5C2|nr:protein piccolo-like isoform X3 [Homalodisca vitripennis]